MAGAAAVVDLVRPQRPARKGVQRKAGAVVKEHRARHVDVALQHPGVIAALVAGQRADRVGAGDVGGAAVILAAVVDQQKAVRLDGGVRAGLGVVVHHRGVGAPGGNGREAVVKIAGLFAAAGLQHALDVAFAQRAAFGQRFFQVHLKADHRHAVADVALADVGELGLVLDALERRDRVAAQAHGEGRVLPDRRVQRIVGGALFQQHGLGLIVTAQEGQELVVAAQRHAAFGQRGRVGLAQAAGRDEQRAGIQREERERHGQRRAGQVPRAQVQQPGQAVQLRHGQRRRARFAQLCAHGGELFGHRRAGLRGREQLARGVGQSGAHIGPQRADDVAVGQRRAGLFQRRAVLFHRGGGRAAAVQQQRLPGGKLCGQVFFHGGHPGGPGVHALDLGAGHLLVALDIKTAVHPQRAARRRHHQRGVFARKAGKPGQGVVVVGQVFAGMGVAGHEQHAVAARRARRLPQSGDLFVCGHCGRLLLY